MEADFSHEGQRGEKSALLGLLREEKPSREDLHNLSLWEHVPFEVVFCQLVENVAFILGKTAMIAWLQTDVQTFFKEYACHDNCLIKTETNCT